MTPQGHWFRQESKGAQSIVHTGSVNDGARTLFRVTAFVFDVEESFREKVEGSRAEFSGDSWILADASVVSAAGPRKAVSRYELRTRLPVAELRRSFVGPDGVSVWSLPSFIETARLTELDADRFRVTFHTLLNSPFMLLAMVLIAATVSCSGMAGPGGFCLLARQLGFCFMLPARL